VERERGRELASRPHGSATTTPNVREAIQASQEKNTVLASRYGVDPKTIAKWKARNFSSDVQIGAPFRKSCSGCALLRVRHFRSPPHDHCTTIARPVGNHCPKSPFHVLRIRVNKLNNIGFSRFRGFSGAPLDHQNH